MLEHAVVVRRDVVRPILAALTSNFNVTYRPEFIHPFASAIDSPDLKVPNKLTVIKLDSKPAYVRLPERPREVYDDYGKYSLEEWHKKHRQYVE
ncbi:hypothetical protein C0989_012189 [Termitomyces sp. Mn162]|nr:hypothetical protein C0989_012189 [Termitomyces sp. Mn162]